MRAEGGVYGRRTWSVCYAWGIYQQRAIAPWWDGASEVIAGETGIEERIVTHSREVWAEDQIVERIAPLEGTRRDVNDEGQRHFLQASVAECGITNGNGSARVDRGETGHGGERIVAHVAGERVWEDHPAQRGALEEGRVGLVPIECVVWNVRDPFSDGQKTVGVHITARLVER